MKALVKSCNIYCFWSGMPRHAKPSRKTKCQYLQEGLIYFVYLLHAVTH